MWRCETYFSLFVCSFCSLLLVGIKAIIVELKALFFLNITFITFCGGSHHWISRNYDKWCQLSPLIYKMLQEMLEEVSGTGILWHLLIIFLHRFHLFIFCKKMQTIIIIIMISLFQEGKPNEHSPIFLGAFKTLYIQYTLYIQNTWNEYKQKKIIYSM